MCSKGNVYTTLSLSNKYDLKPCNWRNKHKTVHVCCVCLCCARVCVCVSVCLFVCLFVFFGGGGGGNGSMWLGVKCKFKTLKYTNL